MAENAIEKRPVNAEQTIRRIAAEHGIVAERTEMDDWADDVARLSDTEVPQDEVADLVVTLSRRGVITSKQVVELISAYAMQRGA